MDVGSSDTIRQGLVGKPYRFLPRKILCNHNTLPKPNQKRITKSAPQQAENVD
jgi:hypothetical protein